MSRYQLADDFCRTAEECRRYWAFYVAPAWRGSVAPDFDFAQPLNQLAHCFYLQPPRLPAAHN